MEENCIHEWKPTGLWDGKTSDGLVTGGMIYECTKCGEKETSRKRALVKGGSIIEDDVLGEFSEEDLE